MPDAKWDIVHESCTHRCSLIVQQAALPRRADPTELKAIFEKVGFYLCIYCLPLQAFLVSIETCWIHLLCPTLKPSGHRCVCICFPPDSTPASGRMASRQRTLWAGSSVHGRSVGSEERWVGDDVIKLELWCSYGITDRSTKICHIGPYIPLQNHENRG